MRHCRNPICEDFVGVGRVVPLCASCRYIGKAAFTLGAGLAGVAVALLRLAGILG